MKRRLLREAGREARWRAGARGQSLRRSRGRRGCAGAAAGDGGGCSTSQLYRSPSPAVGRSTLSANLLATWSSTRISSSPPALLLLPCPLASLASAMWVPAGPEEPLDPRLGLRMQQRPSSSAYAAGKGRAGGTWVHIARIWALRPSLATIPQKVLAEVAAKLGGCFCQRRCGETEAGRCPWSGGRGGCQRRMSGGCQKWGSGAPGLLMGGEGGADTYTHLPETARLRDVELATSIPPRGL